MTPESSANRSIEFARKYSSLPFETAADRIVAAIVSDIGDRRGVNNAFHSIDDEVKEDIYEVWRSIIRVVLSQPLGELTDKQKLKQISRSINQIVENMESD